MTPPTDETPHQGRPDVVSPERDDATPPEEYDRLLRQADAAYTPIPEFHIWAKTKWSSRLWDDYRARLEEMRNEASPDAIQRVQEAIIRAAAVESPALEGLFPWNRGLTVSVASFAAGWEATLDAQGSDARELFSAQLRGFDSVMDIATQHRSITEVWIREVHAILCTPQVSYRVMTPAGYQEHPLPKGQYKIHPNHVLVRDEEVHSYAPVESVPAEMRRLVDQLGTERFRESHPVLQAAYAHYALVSIHPFADGNGRVARSLASIFFYRAASIPLLVYSDQKDEYFDALSQADGGSYGPFIEFVSDRGIDTLGDLQLRLAAGAFAPVESAVTAIRAMYTAHGGLSHVELDAISERIQDHLSQLVSVRAESVSSEELNVELIHHAGSVLVIPGYRKRVREPSRLLLKLHSAPPAASDVTAHIEVHIDRDSLSPFSHLIATTGALPDLEVRLKEAHPQLGESLKSRMAIWVDTLFSELLTDLSLRAEQALRKSGY